GQSVLDKHGQLRAPDFLSREERFTAASVSARSVQTGPSTADGGSTGEMTTRLAPRVCFQVPVRDFSTAPHRQRSFPALELSNRLTEAKRSGGLRAYTCHSPHNSAAPAHLSQHGLLTWTLGREQCPCLSSHWDLKDTAHVKPSQWCQTHSRVQLMLVVFPRFDQ
ncbi:unnamed protein product, partial [Gulo gulo]